ncbi:MAG TPA: Eco29kI family restriction endonuclease [Verrucomicrobiae bacterium]|nr:Eco29kI family restriction endonuclease [Verrucomicrobiae bacterium]
MAEESFKKLLIEIGELRKTLSTAPRSGVKRREMEALIEKAISDLHELLRVIDPIKLPELVYNPTDPDTFAEAIGNKLIVQDEQPLSGFESFRFYGSGLYALYYKGSFDAYAPIRETATPIYVGKADPPKGAKTPKEQGDKLWSRLKEHRDSIKEVEDYCGKMGIKGNLKLRDFAFRYLVTASGWQIAAEGHLIALFRPVWNKETSVVQGIGKHGDASETRANERSRWDTLHPGRDWATHEGNKPNRLSVPEIKALVLKHFELCPPKHL